MNAPSPHRNARHGSGAHLPACLALFVGIAGAQTLSFAQQGDDLRITLDDDIQFTVNAGNDFSSPATTSATLAIRNAFQSAPFPGNFCSLTGTLDLAFGDGTTATGYLNGGYLGTFSGAFSGREMFITWSLDGAVTSPTTATVGAGSVVLQDYFANGGALPDNPAAEWELILIDDSTRNQATPAVLVEVEVGGGGTARVTSVTRSGDELIVDFRASPGITGWQVEGATDLDDFNLDLSSEATITEPSAGSYRMRLDVSERGPHLFVRIGSS